MKVRIIRENKKKILKEAAMGPDDLPEHYYINVLMNKGQFYNIKYVKKFPGPDRIYGELDIEKTTNNCPDNVFEVVSIKTSKGWGPLLYDVAMELIHNYENGVLKSDPAMVSGDAKGVWDFYDKNRTDVKKHQLDIHDSTLDYVFGDEVPKEKLPKKITPNDPSDDCVMDSAIYWEIGKGDWTKHSGSDQRKAARENPEAAENWSNQSISKAFEKSDTSTIMKLLANQQIKIRGN